MGCRDSFVTMTTDRHQIRLWSFKVYLYSLSRLNMDCSRTEISYLRVVTEDVDSFDKVAELYFEAGDNANGEEAYDSPWDGDNSSESG